MSLIRMSFPFLILVTVFYILSFDLRAEEKTENKKPEESSEKDKSLSTENGEKGGFDPFLFIVRPGRESQIIYLAYEKIINAYIKVITQSLKKTEAQIEKIEDNLYAENKEGEIAKNLEAPEREEWKKLKDKASPYVSLINDFNNFLEFLRKLQDLDRARKSSGVIQKAHQEYMDTLEKLEEAQRKIERSFREDPYIAKLLQDNLPVELRNIADINKLDITPSEKLPKESNLSLEKATLQERKNSLKTLDKPSSPQEELKTDTINQEQQKSTEAVNLSQDEISSHENSPSNEPENSQAPTYDVLDENPHLENSQQTQEELESKAMSDIIDNNPKEETENQSELTERTEQQTENEEKSLTPEELKNLQKYNK